MELNALSDEDRREIEVLGACNTLKGLAQSNDSVETDPVAIYRWKDEGHTDAEGWVVMDTIINGVAGGGIFMHAQATCAETAAIARNMSRKFTVCDPQIGGAKAGIRFDHRDPRAKAVLRRFIVDHGSLLRNTWVTAGDLNTDDSFIERVIQDELGLPTCQATLGRIISEKKNQPDLSTQLAGLLVRSASDYFPLIEAAVGYGVASCVKMMAPKKRVIIQGFGAVGSSLAYYLERHHIAVVALADKDGFIHRPGGLPIAYLLELRKRKLETLHEDSQRAECSKNFFKWLSEEERDEWSPVPRDPSWSDQDFLVALLASEEAEVFAPCAQRYQITPTIVDVMLGSTWKDVPKESRFIISGANNPYGIVNGSTLEEDKTGVVISKLHAAGVCIVPDWVANSGTAQLFHRGLSIDFQHKSAHDVLDACAAPILSFLKRAIDVCYDQLPYLVYACSQLARERLQKPIPMKPHFAPNPAHSLYALPPPEKLLHVETRLAKCLSVVEECTTRDELLSLLSACSNPVAYDGFEPSGRMHIAQGLMKTNIVNQMTQSGFTYVFWIADFFAQLNHKMGGDLQKIQTVGHYFIEIWRACGMDTDRVKFLWASEETQARRADYWELLIDISSKTSLTRVQRCIQIMGRNEKDSLTASQILYPVMQCADIFFLGVDVCQLGMDQRKVNMLAREYATKAKRASPIIMSHPMLMGLKKDQAKMSKSCPDSAIFMEDSVDEVTAKIKKAYCPEKEATTNPCMNYMKHIVFPSMITRGRGVRWEFAHDKPRVYPDYESFEKDYVSGDITPQELKYILIRYLNELLQPVRKHFAENKAAAELLEKVKSYRRE